MKIKELLHELRHHLPFTIFATISAILLCSLWIYFIKIPISADVFEFSHEMHIVLSAIVTSAMFYKYKKQPINAILIGIFASIIVGSLSDIVFPYIGAISLGIPSTLHLPIFEMPLVIIFVALAGSLIGIKIQTTKMPHFLHVFVSAFASLFYLLAFSSAFNILFFIESFFIVLISVVIPCCVSDIVFPFFFLGEKIKRCDCH